MDVLLETSLICSTGMAASDALCQRTEMVYASHENQKAVAKYERKKARVVAKALATGEPVKEVKAPTLMEEKDFSLQRTARFGATGAVWNGPITTLNFSVLDAATEEGTVVGGIEKTFLNTFFSPLFHGGMFFINEIQKDGATTEQAWKKMWDELWDAQMVIYLAKIPINLVVFTVMPTVPLQALCMRIYDLFLYIYLSHVAEREKASLDALKEDSDSDEEEEVVEAKEGGDVDDIESDCSCDPDMSDVTAPASADCTVAVTDSNSSEPTALDGETAGDEEESEAKKKVEVDAAERKDAAILTKTDRQLAKLEKEKPFFDSCVTM